MNPLRVTFLTTGLDRGGAETVLFDLLRRIDRRCFAPTVISLADRGRFGAPIESMGIPVHAVGLPQGRPTPRGTLRLLKAVLASRPDLIQGWMYHGNFAAQIVRLFRRVPVCWCLQNSLLTFAVEKPLTRIMIQLLAGVSRSPAAIVYASHTSRSQHERLGFAGHRGIVIPNGVDSVLFQPAAEARQQVRAELGLGPAAVLVGLIARFHPQKDHANFMRAAVRLVASGRDVHFLLAGAQIDDRNTQLRALLDERSLRPRVHLLGERDDMPRLTAALDLATSSSAYGEAVSVAILEAMACGVPCVVTDVGDHRRVVGSTGIVVPPGDSAALARAWQAVLELSAVSRHELGAAARRRAENEYSIAQCVARYQELYLSLQ